MYKFLFYHYYMFFNYFKELMPSSIFSERFLPTILLLSGLEVFNMMSLGRWLDVLYLKCYTERDFILLCILVSGGNALFFLYKKRYRKMLENCEKSNGNIKFVTGILTLVYTILTIYIWSIVPD